MPYFTTQFKAICQVRRAAVSAIATEAGLDQSNLSRVLHGERQMTLDNLSRLVTQSVILTESDKLNLIKAWLVDNTPEEFRDRVLIDVQPSAKLNDAELDDLQAALRFIEKSSSSPEFADWIIKLHKMLTAASSKKKK